MNIFIDIGDVYKPWLVAEERSGQVAVARIRQQSNNGLALVFRTLCQHGSCIDSSAAGDTDEHALFASDGTTGLEGVLVFNGDDFIINAGVQGIGHKACANALNLMRPGNAFGQDGRAGGLHSHDLHIGILRFQIFTYTGQGTAGANASYENIYLSVVSAQISGPVVALWMAGLAGFTN